LSYGSPEPQDDEYSRDLSIGESFTKSFDLARKNYLRVLPVFIVFGILAALISAYVTDVTPTLSLPSSVSGMTQAQVLATAGALVRYIEFEAGNFFLTSLVLYVAAGIGIWQIGKRLAEKRNPGFTVPDRINYVSLAITTIVAVAIIEISGIIIIGPLIFGTMLYLCLSASTLEGKSVLEAFGKSRSLISGRWGKTFIVFIGIQIIVYIGAALVSGIVSLADSSTVITMAVQNFVMALELPLVSASMVVLFLSYKRGQERVTMPPPPSLYDNLRPQPMGSFANQKFCSACGSSVSAGEKFCHNCGAALSTQQ
jgi:hypothetical protein